MAEQAMREVTLDEWCAKLWPGHCVNTELARLRAQLAEANERAEKAEQYATGHLPSCRGADVIAGRCDCGYLQGEAYRDLVQRADDAESALAASESKRKLLATALDQCNSMALAAASDFPGASKVHAVAIAALAATDAASALEEPR